MPVMPLLSSVFFLMSETSLVPSGDMGSDSGHCVQLEAAPPCVTLTHSHTHLSTPRSLPPAPARHFGVMFAHTLPYILEISL